MSLRLATRLLAGALLVLAVGSGPVAAQSLSAGQKEEVERIIRSYLLDHPEVLVEALQAAEEKSKKEAEEHARKAIGERRDQLVADPAAPVAGNPNGDVTIVEFFDYRCPYCKQVHPSIQALLKEDKQVRLVFKEFPILGRDSLIASRAALAAQKQGKYLPFHDLVMGAKGQLSEESVMQMAQSVGLDVEKLKADMAAPDIEANLKRNYELARALDIRGTPAFVVGGELLPGAVDVATLKQKVADARKAK